MDLLSLVVGGEERVQKQYMSERGKGRGHDHELVPMAGCGCKAAGVGKTALTLACMLGVGCCGIEIQTDETPSPGQLQAGAFNAELATSRGLVGLVGEVSSKKKSRGEAHCGCPEGDAKDSAAVLSRLTEDCTGCTFPGSPIRFLERYLRLYLSRYRCTLAKAGPVALVWPA